MCFHPFSDFHVIEYFLIECISKFPVVTWSEHGAAVHECLLDSVIQHEAKSWLNFFEKAKKILFRYHQCFYNECVFVVLISILICIHMKVWWAKKSSFRALSTFPILERGESFSPSFFSHDMFHDVRHNSNNLLYGS